ncbi:unnamed protein product [Trichobilharzia szidati]|nr:unnamed protein product [Trichobilharzia szidati]
MKTTTHEGKLLCLYEVTNGITSESETITIAKNIGLPQGVIERALELRNSPAVMNLKFVEARIKKVKKAMKILRINIANKSTTPLGNMQNLFCRHRRRQRLRLKNDGRSSH